MSALLKLLPMVLLLATGLLPRRMPSPPAGTDPAVRAAAAAWLAGDSTPTVRVLHPALDSSIARLVARSPSFRRGWDEIERSGIPVLVGAHDQLWWMLRLRELADLGWESAEMSWPERSDHPLRRAAIIVRLARLRGPLAPTLSPAAADRALDAVVARAVYANFLPAVEARRSIARCWAPGTAPRPQLESDCLARRFALVMAEYDGAAAGSVAEVTPSSLRPSR